jgi:uncharacterized protein (DUF2164 family)
MLQFKFPREQKEQLIANIKAYFLEERSEEIGNIAAEALLDYMITEIGPLIYNQAIGDSRKLINEKMQAVEDDLYALEKPVDLLKKNW